MGPLNIPHLHLLLNHVPTVGTAVGVAVLLLALARRSGDLTRASLEILFLVAVATLPVYLTGVAADQVIDGLDGVAWQTINAHETAALLAFVWMQAAGLAAWLVLWQMRRGQRPSRAGLSAVVGLSGLTLALMARAAVLGGEIRHPEIVVGPAAAASEELSGWLTSEAIEDVVQAFPWVWPVAETLHFIGLCLVVGVLLTINLRVLGAMKGVPFAALHRLLPWGMLGFGLNLLTGMLFFIAAATQYTGNVVFFWKAVFLAIAGAHFLFLTVVDGPWRLQAGEEAGVFDKVVAVTALGAWAGVIYAGRMLPFLGNAY